MSTQVQDEPSFLNEDKDVWVDHKAVLQITEAVHNGRSMSEIQHSINVGAISNPSNEISEKALVTLANEICSLKDLAETNVIEETSAIEGNVDVGVQALVRAIEKTAIECDEVSSLITGSKTLSDLSPEIETEIGDVGIEGYAGVNVTIHEDDVLMDDVEDVIRPDNRATKHIQPIEIISESNLSEVRISIIIIL